MKIHLHILESIDAKIFEELQEFTDKTLPFKVEISVDKQFAFTKEKKIELDKLGDDVDISRLEDYDCIEHLGRDFINLSKITCQYQKENLTRIFYVNVPFYHTAILPIPFVYAGRKIEVIDGKCTQIFEMNGTVDFSKHHLLVCGTRFQTKENYSAIFHEFFHLLHDPQKGIYANGKQTAHCTNLADGERCIMNTPEKVFYTPDEKNKREKLGTKFCTSCAIKLTELAH